MKPPRFDYAAPSSTAEVLSLLSDNGDAKILSGGQSLVPLLNMRLATPQLLVDINRIEDSAPLAVGETLTVGPLVRQSELEHDEAVATNFSLLKEAVAWVGHPQIRNRGTVLGSLAHADPAAELPVAFLALDAEMTVAGPSSRRTVPADQFFVHIMESDVQPDEMLVSALVRRPPGGTGTAFLEIARRHGDFAVVSAAIAVNVESGVIRWARIAMGGVAPTPIRAREAEAALEGAPVSTAAFGDAAAKAAAKTDPPADIHGTSQYRKDVISVLVRRGLERAVARADETRRSSE